MDNFTGHGSQSKPLQSEDGQICLMFLPANTTSVIQPMDQNPINITQTKCKKLLLSKVVAQENEPIDVLLKKHSIKDAIINLNEAWNTLDDSVLIKAWRPLFEWRDDEFDEEDLLPLSKVRTEIYMEQLKDLQVILNRISGPGDNEMSIEEVKEWNENLSVENETSASDSSDDEMDYCEMDLQKVSHNEAIQHVNSLLKWCNDYGQSASFISNLNGLRAQIVEVMLKKEKKQTTMNDYFKTS